MITYLQLYYLVANIPVPTVISQGLSVICLPSTEHLVISWQHWLLAPGQKKYTREKER